MYRERALMRTRSQRAPSFGIDASLGGGSIEAEKRRRLREDRIARIPGLAVLLATSEQLAAMRKDLKAPLPPELYKRAVTVGALMDLMGSNDIDRVVQAFLEMEKAATGSRPIGNQLEMIALRGLEQLREE